MQKGRLTAVHPDVAIKLMERKHPLLFEPLSPTVERLIREFGRIPTERKEILKQLTGFVEQRLKSGQPSYLNFICTHNSRRSQISQIWAQMAAYYYQIPQVICYSGGTEATAFNPRAVTAIRDAGFEVNVRKDGDNPVYEVAFANDAPPVITFSKTYDDSFNQCNDFAAVMTCSHADENCPLVIGATARIALTYDDPKASDGTQQEKATYAERVHEIGREILFAFSQIKA